MATENDQLKTVNDRIKAVRKAYDMTQREFGKSIGISDVAVSKIESGENKPSARTIRAISREYELSEEWLLNGTGEMALKETELTTVRDAMNDNPFTRALFIAISELLPYELAVIEGVCRRTLQLMENSPATMIDETPYDFDKSLEDNKKIEDEMMEYKARDIENVRKATDS